MWMRSTMLLRSPCCGVESIEELRDDRDQERRSLGVDARKARRLKRHERTEANLENVIIQCTEKLRPKESAEAFVAYQ